MPVKSAHPRKIKIKKAPAQKSAGDHGHDEEEAAPIIPLKSKMPVELDESETVITLEEKGEDELQGTDEESDELGLDDSGLEEELDPFNDKWEA